jgi:hypothetical protein
MRDKRFDNRPTSPEEFLLIRAGHHLWLEYKLSLKPGRPCTWQTDVLLAALDTVWEAKRSLRAILRAEWLKSWINRSERGTKALEKHRAQKSSQA